MNRVLIKFHKRCTAGAMSVAVLTLLGQYTKVGLKYYRSGIMLDIVLQFKSCKHVLNQGFIFGKICSDVVNDSRFSQSFFFLYDLVMKSPMQHVCMVCIGPDFRVRNLFELPV